MSVDSLAYNALSGIAPVQANDYEAESAEETYITFNYFTTPTDYADDEPEHELYSLQAHLFCPPGVNSIKKRKQIKKALKAAGFSHPRTFNASDADGQHHIFECEIAQGV